MLRVLDLTQFEAGPSCTEALAWLGALTSRSKTRSRAAERAAPCWAGSLGPEPEPEPGTSGISCCSTPTKYCTVNLKSERGLDLVKNMVNAPTSWWVVSSVGYVVHAVNPSVIYAQVKGLRHRGPLEQPRLRHDRASDRLRHEHYWGADGPPLKPGATLGDTHRHVAYHQHLGGPLPTPRHRAGERLEIAMQDAMLQYIRVALSNDGDLRWRPTANFLARVTSRADGAPPFAGLYGDVGDAKFQVLILRT